MNSRILGRLAKVDLREAWTSESSGFTPWLPLEVNLETMHRVFSPLMKQVRDEAVLL